MIGTKLPAKDKFNDYLFIDQNFACDNLSKTKKNLFKQVEKSESELFLVGVGHVKLGLLHELKQIKPAVYLDIGVGVDALAGLINIYRPYLVNGRIIKLATINFYIEKVMY